MRVHHHHHHHRIHHHGATSWQQLLRQQLRRLLWRIFYRLRRHLTLTTGFLILLWIYVLYRGERTIFTEHIEVCDWKNWEEWPSHATPHRLVLIADPQLVDPHTYPGRPWPLSTLTESYTDTYMARNFRLINSRLDPDTIVFLGDLFDGGREWEPSRRRKLGWVHRALLVDFGVLLDDEPPWEPPPRPQANAKRSLDSYHMAMAKAPVGTEVRMVDHALAPDGRDLKEFTHGEGGRWKKYDDRQWKSDLARFSRIFWDSSQLYPEPQRELLPAYAVPVDTVSLDNGADNTTHTQYATIGGKPRRVIGSLPGNHDLGFGSGVQWAVRDRFQQYFGDGNRIDVIGNHTFVSIDSPSLSAQSQWLRDGGETTEAQILQYEHIWKPTMDFLGDLHDPAHRLVSKQLETYYPTTHQHARWRHTSYGLHDPDVSENGGFSSSSVETPAVQLPVILLSHVPLYRPQEAGCGPLRERGSSIPIAMGNQYQNVLTNSLSREIVSKVAAAGEIAQIFSGDDHDYCDVTHKYNLPPWNAVGENVRTTLRHIREITVKSFSWAMGVRRPGFQLVSLWNPVDAHGRTVGTPLPTIQSHLCLLPDQLVIFKDYVLLFAFTFIILLLRALILALRGPSPDDYLPDDPYTRRWDLPTPASRFLQRNNNDEGAIANANGHVFSSRSSSTHGGGRKRATSTSTDRDQQQHLAVPRSYNARTRSVSPAATTSLGGGASGGSGPYPPDQPSTFRPTPGSLIEKAGYYPRVAWQDPDDADEDYDHESDEESHVGVIDEDYYHHNNDDDREYDFVNDISKRPRGRPFTSTSTSTNSGGGSSSSIITGKSKKRRKQPGRLARTGELFRMSLIVVALPSAWWYWYLVKRG